MKGSAAEPYRECPAKATGNNRFDAYPNITDWYETVKLNYGVDYQNGGTCHFNPTPDTGQKCWIFFFSGQEKISMVSVVTWRKWFRLSSGNG